MITKIVSNGNFEADNKKPRGLKENTYAMSKQNFVNSMYPLMCKTHKKT